MHTLDPLHIKAKTVKLLKENILEDFHDLEVGKDSLVAKSNTIKKNLII